MLEASAAVIKGLGYAAAFGAAGIVIARSSLTGGATPQSLGPTRLARGAGIVLALTACDAAFLLFLRLGGQVDAPTLGAVFRSPLGLALGLQLAGGLWVAGFAHRRIARVGAASIILAFGVVGHAASRGVLTSVTVLLHVTAAAWWFGGLWILLFDSSRPSTDFSPLVSRFSKKAVWIVGGLLATALATAALLLEFRIDPALAYQQGLATKLGLTAVLLTLAAVNRLVLMPRLAANDGRRIWLRSTIVAELLLFVAVMGTTAYLVTYLSPHDAANAEHGHDGPVAVGRPIGIVEPWAPAMFAGAKTGAGYMVIVNNQPVADRLIAASSPWAEHVSLHVTISDGTIARMREMTALPVPAGGRVTMKPGVYHLMFTDLYSPFVEGDVVPLTLVFERAGAVSTTLHVRPLGSSGEDHDH